MTDASLTSDQLATPKTDAAAWHTGMTDAEVVYADFARAQERRIAELEGALQEISEFISGHEGYVFDDITKVLLGTRP